MLPTRVVSGRHFGIKFDSCLEPFWVTLPGSFEATPGGRIEQGLVELVGAFLAPGRRTRFFLFLGQGGGGGLNQRRGRRIEGGWWGGWPGE